jgi:hypothetical protein
VAKLAAVATHGNAAILDKASRTQTLEVLLWALRPAWCKLRTTRLSGQLDRQNEVSLGIANKVDNSHVGGNVLLLGDEIDRQAILAQSSLHIGQAELVIDSTRVGSQADAKSVQILFIGGIDQGLPRILSRHLRNASPVDDTTATTIECNVTLLVAQLALLRVGRAGASGVALNTTGVASTVERTLDALVSTVRLVVADLSAVEALASQAATLGLVGAFACEVAGLVAAVASVSMMK